ncbi:unnamed protein product [Moneuplotes crassus]|uniref:Uncharacterized protein n=1 Tax=Euplotes crassus TaxID=5936 RepID=A0AAD1XCM7_EUPCR|nr:unnamed protein product [Moneuplotes crassus]
MGNKTCCTTKVVDPDPEDNPKIRKSIVEKDNNDALECKKEQSYQKSSQCLFNNSEKKSPKDYSPLSPKEATDNTKKTVFGSGYTPKSLRVKNRSPECGWEIISKYTRDVCRNSIPDINQGPSNTTNTPERQLDSPELDESIDLRKNGKKRSVLSIGSIFNDSKSVPKPRKKNKHYKFLKNLEETEFAPDSFISRSRTDEPLQMPVLSSVLLTQQSNPVDIQNLHKDSQNSSGAGCSEDSCHFDSSKN